MFTGALICCALDEGLYRVDIGAVRIGDFQNFLGGEVKRFITVDFVPFNEESHELLLHLLEAGLEIDVDELVVLVIGGIFGGLYKCVAEVDDTNALQEADVHVSELGQMVGLDDGLESGDKGLHLIRVKTSAVDRIVATEALEFAG